MSAPMFTTPEIIERLKVLWRKLEDEGRYVGGNTIQLAVVRLGELTHQPDIKPDTPLPTKWECAARKQGTAGGNDPADCDWPGCGCDPAVCQYCGETDQCDCYGRLV